MSIFNTPPRKHLNLKQISLSAVLTFSAGVAQAEDASQVVDALTGKAISTIESSINEFANDVANSFGNGNTEISISNIESGNPSYSIKTIQPLTTPNKDDKELVFMQGSIASGENEGDRRNTINLGLGKRILVEADKAIIGANVFVDYETSSKHKRTSLGLEYQRSNFSATANKYWALSDKITINGYTEEALGGHDIKLTGQAPYAPWATIKGTHYYWDQTVGDNITGNILGVEIELSPSTSFELGSENSSAMNRTAYAELTIKLPFDDNEKVTNFALDDTPFRAQADMSLELLAMVERSNKVKVEKIAVNSDASGSDSVASMIDGDGNIYTGIKIGIQTWMIGNLYTTKYADGTSILSGIWSDPSDTITDIKKYGKLYNWDVAMNNSSTEKAQGICASGWHIPSEADWMALEGALGMSTTDQNTIGWRGTDEGKQLKVGGTSKFEGQLAGYRYSNGEVHFRERRAYFWSSTTLGAKAYTRRLYSTDDRSRKLEYDNGNTSIGMSVRCIQD